MHGKGHQAHAHFRVEALDGLHQADVAFLNQVGLGQAIACIATGDMYDETQVGHHHLPSGLKILLIIETLAQITLLLDRQQRDAVDRVHIGFQVCTGYQGIGRLQRCGHSRTSDLQNSRLVGAANIDLERRYKFHSEEFVNAGT
ncbi:hypothetical protein D3C75_927400 [compost metagenome]